MASERRLRIKTLVMVLAMVVCANAGDLMLKRGMSQIGGLQLRDARRRVWVRLAHIARGCFLARVGVVAALVWRGTDLRGRIVGGANETTHDRSGWRGRGMMRVILALAILILGSTG